MELHEIFLTLMAAAVIGADIFVRLRVAPSRRDQLVADLLDMLSTARSRHARRDVLDIRAGTISDCLLRHFDQSYTSRNIISALATAPQGMTQKEIEQDFAVIAGHTGKAALPASVLRKVVMILMAAGMVKVGDGRIKMTRMGWELYGLLQNRRAA